MELHSGCVVGGFIHGVYTKLCVPRLFLWADRGEWERIPERCKKSRREIMFRHKYAPADTTLHRLLRPLNSCPLLEREKEVITKEELESIEQSSSGSDEKNGDCSDSDNQSTVELDNSVVQDLLVPAVQAIVTTNPRSVKLTDMFGRTPLHMACLCQLTPPRTAAAIWILETMPNTAFLIDNETGQSALHMACLAEDESGDCRDQLVEAFIKADPYAMERLDKAGNKPQLLSKTRQSAA